MAILAITENQEVILVRQYRHTCNTELLEIPAGKLAFIKFLQTIGSTRRTTGIFSKK